jgi:hypothetical protein
MVDAKLEIFTVVIHVLVLWVVTPCSDVVEHQRFRGLRHENEGSMDLRKVVYSHITTRCHNPADSDMNRTAINLPLGYGLDDRGFESRQGPGIFLFTTASRPALGLTQPTIQWVRGALFLGVKRSGREADHSPPSSAEVKE